MSDTSSLGSSYIDAAAATPAGSIVTPASPTDSLPSSSDSNSSATSTVGDTDADAEWKESLQQLELLLTMVLVPYLGKYFGRKAAYWGWARFMEWKYPVEVVITSKAAFKGAGAVEAAASI
ncbi:MAG: hypothetical protein M1814_005663 [Vezdaea aestivalis]|nr:MAG: hypothetical protein M1814_005663 [Vezdaea aestivalis]